MAKGSVSQQRLRTLPLKPKKKGKPGSLLIKFSNFTILLLAEKADVPS